MDEKTARQISLIHNVASDIAEVQTRCGSALRLLFDDRREPVTIEIYAQSVRFASPQSLGFNLFPVLAMNDAELKALRSVIEAYSERVGKILDGCSIKVSPEIRQIQEKIEAKLEEYRARVQEHDENNARRK